MKESPHQLSRRRLFAGAGAAGAVAAVAAVVPAVKTTGETATAAGAQEQPSGGYRVTQHVLRYYQTARV